MSRCVNCSLFLVHPLPRRQVEEATDVMLRILRSWVCPATLTEQDTLCQECFTLLERASLKSSTESAVSRAFGHKQVCFGCGTSILRAKTHRVPLNSPERDVIIPCIPTQQVQRLEKVCLPCWTHAYRSVRRQAQCDQNRQKPIVKEEADVPTTSSEDPADQSSVSETSTTSRQSPIPTPSPQTISQLYDDQNSVRRPKITSRIYKRAAASSRHCIFGECGHTERLLVPSVIKEMLLLEHKLYVPPSARICRHHLNNASWGELAFNYDDFTGWQMDDMMTIMDRASRRHIKQAQS